jgi:hypothetical protein
LARGWAISGIGEQTREAAMAAADAAGMPLGAWVEQVLHQALEARAEPARPEGVELGELEAMVRRVVAEELQAVREALDRLEARAAAPNPAGGGPVTPLRERWRQRRSR